MIDEYQPQLPDELLPEEVRGDSFVDVMPAGRLDLSRDAVRPPKIVIRCNCCGGPAPSGVRMAGAYYHLDVDDCIYCSRGLSRASKKSGYMEGVEQFYSKDGFEGLYLS